MAPFRRVLSLLCISAAWPLFAHAQPRFEPGRPIGKVSTHGQLIVLELDEGALGKANLFDLVGRTLRFIPNVRDAASKAGAAKAPASSGYRVENAPLAWDADFGPEHRDPEVKLQNFIFPFSGKNWDSFSVGTTGSIRFGPPATTGGGPSQFAGGGRAPGGVLIGRFDQLAIAARNLVNTVPAICVFFKPRMTGPHYVKELADRVVITWDLTEPFGNIQDFTWVKTVNRFQAVLWRDGAIEMSYRELAAKDAIVGVYAVPSEGAERVLSTMNGRRAAGVPAHLELSKARVAVVDGAFLKITLETRGEVLKEGDAQLVGVQYTVSFSAQHGDSTVRRGTAKKSDAQAVPALPPNAVWTIRGFASPGRAGGQPRYIANGPGVSGGVKVAGNMLTIQGTLPSALARAEQVAVSVKSFAAGAAEPASTTGPATMRLSGIRSPEVDLSALTLSEGAFPILYESFHYLALPNPRDMTCTVIKALGDKFDFLAYYSDFRVDNQEAGTPSTGPLGGGPNGGAVTGIGATQRGLDAYCTAGRFQWQYVQPVYVGSIQMQERPPADAPVGSNRDIAYYVRQLAERPPDRKMSGYNYAMSQLGHEMGHRWSAFVSAKVGNETIPLGPTHWARGLHAPAAFPYQRPYEASAMGGGVWQDNFDGTFTQLDDDYYVPASGWSYLDLYLMGLISASEVPDFFVLRNLTLAGRDGSGRPMFKAERTKITIQDVIAAEGTRQPDPEHSQREFNTGIVVIVGHGKQPSRELLERANAIRETWMEYWSVTTGRRSIMTTNPQ
jgi:hypothetical protein